LCAGVVGACGWYANDGCRSAEQAVAADRFAREIVGFLKASPGALAAAERQALGGTGPFKALVPRSAQV